MATYGAATTAPPNGATSSPYVIDRGCATVDRGRSTGYTEGYAAGFTAGEAAHANDHANGFAAGEVAGYASGYASGYADGLAAFPVDETPPVVARITPAGEVAPNDELVVEVTDDGALAYVAIFVTMGGAIEKVSVYRNGEFEPGFTVGSFTEAIAGGLRFHIRRDVGWPPGSVSIITDAVDRGGNIGV